MNAFANWWKESVIYQLYPRSFQDTNEDGIGDIFGIISRLDYLAWLGVGAIWISPIFQSPMADFGYDISDYRSIDPVFGTHEDVDRLIGAAHGLGIKVIFDMVLNHTSDQHPWFLESASSMDNPRRDFYIWRDKPRHGYPNNWFAAFGGRAWTVHPKSGQCYLHSFLAEQPDLNWHHDAVLEDVFGEVAYWLDRGVDGFRLDVINLIVKDQQLKDNPMGWGGRPRPYDLQQHIHDRNQPVAHDKLKRFRSLLDRYEQRMLVGEIMAEKPGEPELAASFLGNGTDELHLAFDFSFTWLPWDAGKWRIAAIRWEHAVPENGWPCWVFGNHDVRRSVSRWGNDERRARIAALFLLTQRGTAFIYYGEELGMHDLPVKRREIQDPIGKRYWPLHKGRDGARRPMKWDATPSAGFSNVDTWLPLDDSNVKSVAQQRKERDSLLYLYHDIIQMRNHDKVLRLGRTQWIDLPDAPDILAYAKDDGSDSRLILLNFSASEVRFSAIPVLKVMESGLLRVLYSTIAHDTSVEDLGQSLSLQGYQGMICCGA